jgi:small subunit ribosomal protein S6
MIGRRDFPPMTEEKPTYDLMLLLDTGADDALRSKLVADTRASIEAGGELVGDYDWGVRALAYPIEHRTDAQYHLFQFHATAQLLQSLDRALHIADGVVRHRIIKLEPGTPPPPQMRPEARPATAASPTPASPEAVAPAPEQPEAAVAPTSTA